MLTRTTKQSLLLTFMLGTALLLSSCFSGGLSLESSEESYFLHSASTLELSSDLDQEIKTEIERRLSGLLIDPHLSYRVDSGQDYTDFRNGSASAYWPASGELSTVIDNQGDYFNPYQVLGQVDDPFSSENSPTGTVSVNGNQVQISFSFAATQDGFESLNILCSFQRSAAENAIDNLRNSSYNAASGEFGQPGSSTFNVAVDVQGIADSVPFSSQQEVQFRPRRVRYSTPI